MQTYNYLLIPCNVLARLLPTDEPCLAVCGTPLPVGHCDLVATCRHIIDKLDCDVVAVAGQPSRGSGRALVYVYGLVPVDGFTSAISDGGRDLISSAEKTLQENKRGS